MTKKELKGLDAVALKTKLDEYNKAIEFMEGNGFGGATGALKQEVAWIVEIQTGTTPKVDHEAIAVAMSENLNSVLSTKPLGTKAIAALAENVKTAMSGENGLNVNVKLSEDGTLTFTVKAGKSAKKSGNGTAATGTDRAKSPCKEFIFGGKRFESSTALLGTVDEKGHFTGTAGDGTILGTLAAAGTVVALPITSFSKPKEAVKLVKQYKLQGLEGVVKAELKDVVTNDCAEHGIESRLEGDTLMIDFVKYFNVFTTKAPAEKPATETPAAAEQPAQA